MHVPEIELLWWEGCPSTERARSELEQALAELGLSGAEIGMREIRTDAEAQALGFGGSPTIMIDGEDLIGPTSADPGDDEQDYRGRAVLALGGGDLPAGLSCRIYRRRDGRISPTPDPDDLRDALRRAATAVEARR